MSDCKKARQAKRIKVEGKWVVVEILACEKCPEISTCVKWEADAVKEAMRASGIVNKVFNKGEMR